MSKRVMEVRRVLRAKWAAMVFLARLWGYGKPDGAYVPGGRFRPSVYEMRGCCDRYLSKRGGWTKGLVRHLVTREHVARLMGVAIGDLEKALPHGASREMFRAGLGDGLFCPACLDTHTGPDARPCYGKVCVKCYFPVFKDEWHIRLGAGRLAHMDCWIGGE